MAKKEYSMTYEEFEKKVIELYLDGISEDHKEMIKERIDNLLENDPTFLSGLYGDTCFPLWPSWYLWGKLQKSIWRWEIKRHTC